MSHYRMFTKQEIKKFTSEGKVKVLEVANVKAMTDAEINSLKCGDIVTKKDSSGLHSYVVSFKKNGTGMCLTYTDASVVETQSYDYIGGHWVYNSEDKTPLLNFSKMTHSFSELDPTLEDIVEDAIRDEWTDGVACTQEQWIAIKHLLDSSLYINYYNFSMIKTVYTTDSYVFGSIGNMQTDSSLELYFNNINNKLFAKHAYS